MQSEGVGVRLYGYAPRNVEHQVPVELFFYLYPKMEKWSISTTFLCLGMHVQELVLSPIENESHV